MAESEPNEITLTAAEYVLGTLDEGERAAFDQELAHSAEARRELDYWEARLNALALALTPVTPPDQVWHDVRDNIARDVGADRASVTPIGSASSATRRDSGKGWRSLAIAASVAALAMAGVLMIGTGDSPPSDDGAAPAYASMVYDAPTGISWLVTAPEDGRAMSVTALGSYQVPEGKVLQAWLVPADGKPIRIGEWPNAQGSYSMDVSEAGARYISKQASLMVSMEDVGTTDQPLPTGQLMWTSPIARRTS